MSSPKVKGCALIIDGREMDSYDSRAKTARAGWCVWTLSAEQVQQIRGALHGIGDAADPMAKFHR